MHQNVHLGTYSYGFHHFLITERKTSKVVALFVMVTMGRPWKSTPKVSQEFHVGH
jgi:hypothetical protein